MYQVEFDSTSSPFPASFQNREAVCAMCELPDASQHVLIPARDSCPSGYKLFYKGWLMSQQYEQGAKEIICVAQVHK